MDSIAKRKKILQELVKAQQAVKRKYNLIKTHNDNKEHALNKAFKPIVDPIQKLVQLSSRKRKKLETVKNENFSIKPEDSSPCYQAVNLKVEPKDYSIKNKFGQMIPDERPLLQKEFNISDDSQESNSSNDSQESNLSNHSQNIRTSEQEESEISDHESTLHANSDSETSAFETADESEDIHNNIGNQLFHEMEKRDFVDRIYGVYMKGDDLYIGNTPISISSNTIRVGGRNFPKTSGLLELLFKRNPSKDVYDEKDKNNLREIGNISNFHKKKFNPHEEIRKANSKKYAILKEIFSSTGKGIIKPYEKLIPKYKTTHLNTKMDYVKWKDLNEIINYLHLLIAEKYVGYMDHDKEIYSILEELKEAGYIY